MKSHEQDQLELAICIYKDAIARCVALQPALRDLMTIKSRVKNEGLSFLTITLPSFCKDFERSLADGHIDSTLFRSFRKRGSIPAFLQGMTSRIFDQVTGRILDEKLVDVSCIENVRLFTTAFKKLETECMPERVMLSIKTFQQIEHDLSSATIQLSDLQSFQAVSDIVWNCMSNIDIRTCLPKHGPGATQERISGNQKYTWKRWHNRLEPYFPLIDTAYTLGCYPSKELDNVAVVDSNSEEPVRVITVPKTMKGPRIIAIEPACMQYTQQAVRNVLYSTIEHSYFSKGHVNFTDQSINKTLAMKASKDRQLATLDLSEASDRVLHSVALRMFDCNPDLRDAIDACRSTHAKLPDGTVIGPLRKFASMGSALCFPVESMYFYTICIVALLDKHHLPVTSRNIYLVSRDVYVYGDDILVPCTEATTVIDYLHKYHCKVNMSKSFWTGKFRESCGMDAYDGHEVTPTYVRQLRPYDRRQASNLISWIKTANQFEKRGCMLTSAYMFNVCEKLLGKLPVVSENSCALGRTTQHEPISSGRWNRFLQASEIKAWTAVPVYRTDKLGGYGALMKSLLSLTRQSIPPKVFDDDCVIIDDKHLERSARHGAVTLKHRWVTI